MLANLVDDRTTEISKNSRYIEDVANRERLNRFDSSVGVARDAVGAFH